jgi:plasmid replication initiation protein
MRKCRWPDPPQDLARTRLGSLAPRDARDLMAYPFFSLAKTHRTIPIDYRQHNVVIRVEAASEHGIATMWDADVLIWAASRLVEARDAGLAASPDLAATPYEILTFAGRGTSKRDYDRLKAALDRLQFTLVATTLHPDSAEPQSGTMDDPGHAPATGEHCLHRFSWISQWAERADAGGKSSGIDLTIPDWFHRTVFDHGRVLAIDRGYFALTGGLERWLYRLVRKHGGRQRSGWRFDLRHLHAKSASLLPFKRFAFELRGIVRRQALPGYRLAIDRAPDGSEVLTFVWQNLSTAVCGYLPVTIVLSGTGRLVPSGTPQSCYREPEAAIPRNGSAAYEPPNLDSNRTSNTLVVGGGTRRGKAGRGAT